MSIIKARHGEDIQVDEEDLALVKRWTWYIHLGYAFRPGRKGEPKGVFMHRLLMGYPAGLQINHKNFDKLDNRRSNLEAVTQRENMAHARAGGRFGHDGGKPLSPEPTAGIYWGQKSKKHAPAWRVKFGQETLGWFADYDVACTLREVAYALEMAKRAQGQL